MFPTRCCAATLRLCAGQGSLSLVVVQLGRTGEGRERWQSSTGRDMSRDSWVKPLSAAHTPITPACVKPADTTRVNTLVLFTMFLKVHIDKTVPVDETLIAQTVSVTV